MIFGSENISAYTRGNMAIWMVLAFQAGLLNIGGLMAVHSFVSHVTGFATLFSLEYGSGNYAHAVGLLIIPLTFLAGSMVSGILVDLRLKLHRKPKYYIVFGFLFLLTLAIAVGGFNNLFGEFGVPLSTVPGYVLVALLCFTCGVQNGTITLVSKSVVRTTHLTGMTTDLGIGIIRMINRSRIHGIEDEGKANMMRIGVIAFFTFGSAAGVRVFHDWKFRGFIFPCFISGLLFAMTFYFQVLRPRFFKDARYNIDNGKSR
jgi:uncharacterized membrane protein YoaK (UPF0700 family)